MEASPGDATANFLDALRWRGFAMTDDVADMIRFLWQQKRLLEQRLCAAEREIEELNQINYRQVRESESNRQSALKFDDYARPEDLAQALEEGPLRSWPRWRREALASLILRPC
jgi:hypothetical protein